MPNKRFLLFAGFLLCLELLFTSAVQAEPRVQFLPNPTPNFSKGILWQIDSSNGKSSYLFGTIHVDDPRVINLHPKIKTAITASRSMTLELIPDPQALQASMTRMFFTNGQTLRKTIGNKLYKKVTQAMDGHHIPTSMLNMMKPWAVMMTLSVPKGNGGEFLDFKLYNIATQRGMKTYALETYEEQLSIFDNMSLPDQKKMLAQTLTDLHELPLQFEKLRRAWLARDLAKLEEISHAQMPLNDPLMTQLMDNLINKRNQKMLHRMQPRLKEGRAFIAIGALHLPGEQGLLNLLYKQGYKVNAIY